MHPKNVNCTRRPCGDEIEFTFRVPASAAGAAEKVIRTILGMVRSIECAGSRAHAYWNSPERMTGRTYDERRAARLTLEEFSFLTADAAEEARSPAAASNASPHGALHRFTRHLIGMVGMVDKPV